MKKNNVMKKYIFKIIKTALLLILFSNNAFSQGQPTTQGKEFWVAFGDNFYPAAIITLQIRIVATKTTNVTFSYTENSSYNQTFTVNAGQTYTHNLSNQEKVAVYNTGAAAGTSNKSLYITSDENITVYASNLFSTSSDATNVLPVNNYGTSYYTFSYSTFSHATFDGYVIVANEDDTEIREDGVVVKTLNRGEAHSVYESGVDKDVTGRNITSNKPFAMFATNVAQIQSSTVITPEHIFQQMTPVHSWGTTFFVPVTSATRNGTTRDRDHIRILASQDGTTITQTGGTIVTNLGYIMPNNKNTLSSPLNAGEFVELQIDLADGGCYITADKPVAVVSYMLGSFNFASIVAELLGDGAMAWISPIEQTVTSASIAPFFATGYSYLFDDQHHALIVTPTVTKNNTRVSIGSGAPQPLSGGTWTDNAASGYSFYTMNFSATNKTDAYYFENPAGFIIMGYGMGSNDAYYYLAASSSRNLEASFYVNDIHNQDADGQSFCSNMFNFRAVVNFPMSTNVGHLKWIIDGTELLSARDALQFNTQLAVGTHTIKMVALSIGNETFEVESTVTVAGSMTPGAIGSNQSIVSGATANALTSTTPASGGAGTITYQWQSSPNGTSSWTNISGATGLTYSPGTVTSTTYYRRAATCDCGTVYTGSVAITVGTIGDDIITVSGDATQLCSGDGVTLSATASSVNNPVFRWYDASTGGTPLETALTFTPSPNLTETTTFYVSVSGDGVTESTRKAVTVTVLPRTSSSIIKLQ